MDRISGRGQLPNVTVMSCVRKSTACDFKFFSCHFHETDPLTCPKCQGEMRIISFIDQPEVIKKILQRLGLWEESHAPPGRDPPLKEITFRGEPQGRTFDPSYSQVI